MEVLVLFAAALVLFPYIAVIVLLIRTSDLRKTLNARIDRLEKQLNQPTHQQQAASTASSTATIAAIVESLTPTAASSIESLPQVAVVESAIAPSGLPPPDVLNSQIKDSISEPVSITHQASFQKARFNLEPDERSTDLVSSVWRSLLAWFQGGNAIVRVGVIVLLIGVVLLLRFASEHVVVPLEVRLALVAFGGFVLTLLGIRLAAKSNLPQSMQTTSESELHDLGDVKEAVVAALSRRGYALSLEGGGLAILYLTLFAAFRLYHLLPDMLTFGLLASLSVITAALALKQDAFPLAFMAFAGAFLAPILTSDGSGNVVGLFSYYLLLNTAIAWLAHYRTWKVLNLLGAFFTFGLAGFWGWQQYHIEAWATLAPVLRWPLEGLLLVHLGLYLFIVIRYSQQLAKLQTRNQHVPIVDGSLLFGVPILGFGLQAGLLHDLPYALAISSAVLSGVYLLLGRYLLRQGGSLRLLTEGTLALGVGFLALVLPLALDAQWTSVGWAVQGAGLVWIGQRQQRPWSVAFGLLLQLISCGVLAWMALDSSGSINIGLGVLAATLLVSAALLRIQNTSHHETSTDQPEKSSRFWGLAGIVLSVGLVASGLFIDLNLSKVDYFAESHLDSLFATRIAIDLLIIIAAGLFLDRLLGWFEVNWSVRVLLPVTLLVVLASYTSHLFLPLSIVWIILGMLSLIRLATVVSENSLGHTIIKPSSSRGDQVIWASGILLLATCEFVLLWTIPALIPALLILGFIALQRVPAWLNRDRLLEDLALPILVLLGVWVFIANIEIDGRFFGLVYVPLINALDITFALVGFAAFRLSFYVVLPFKKIIYTAMGAAVFWTLTGIVVRTLHEWAGAPLWPDAWHDDTVQTSLTIVWTLLALLLTGIASRRAWREVWIAGIVLLVVVVAKLLLVDLSHVGAMARIISFIGAGLIMLLIGYIAPLPPARAKQNEVNKNGTPQIDGSQEKTVDQNKVGTTHNE
ncbi:DUF2339 domain-containing protein [Aquirhabdus parva]|uniref:DUF2339 domain-containing protein n=1 Tax=Aquirhabdus parva TaxID=2283318 RepID=A0A345P4S3_9GAMM|nr:DUF2339 domain-containing protein [Aquirhabdus parva]AXI02282.1 DUF2339 domain-containing protein [Aquirhabdus parva]